MREHQALEFKEVVSNSFLKTVSAFANYGTGQVVFGIKDDGTVVGVIEPVKAVLSIENSINDSIKPQPNYHIEIDEYNHTIILTVEKGNDPPYLYKNKAYRRNDSSTIEVDITSLRRLLLKGSNLSYDSLPSSHNDLQFERLAAKFKDILGVQSLSQDLLITLGLYQHREGYTIAGELLADTNTYPGVDIAKFGDTINIINDRILLNHMSILDQYDKAVEVYRLYYQYDEIKGAYRETIQTIPEVAFREALANALVHRLWDIKSQIQIAMYDDRLEITSPGNLPDDMTFDDYKNRNISILRNPIIANVFFRLRLIETYGTGIQRILDSYGESLTKPEFDRSSNFICITLPVVKRAKDALPKEARYIYNLVRMGCSTSRDLMKETGFGKTKLLSILNTLAEHNYIQKQGNARATVYKVI